MKLILTLSLVLSPLSLLAQAVFGAPCHIVNFRVDQRLVPVVCNGPVDWDTGESGVITFQLDNILDGDMAIIFLYAQDNVPCTAPAGWNVIDPGTANTSGWMSHAWWKLKNNGEAGLFVITHVGGGPFFGILVGFTAAEVNVLGNVNSGNSSTISASSITNLNIGDSIVFIGGINTNATFSSFSSTGSWGAATKRYSDVQFPVDPISLFVASATPTNIVASGDWSCTASKPGLWSGQLFSLKPKVQ